MEITERSRQMLEKIYREGELPVAVLEKPIHFRGWLDHLIQTGILEKWSPRRGSWRYRVVNRSALRELLEKRFSALAENDGNRVGKVDAALLFSDAHKSDFSECVPVSVRSPIPGKTVRSEDGTSLPVGSLTRDGAALQIAIGPLGQNWRLDGSICVIENPQCFWEAETVLVCDFYLLPQSGGNFSHAFAQWLQDAIPPSVSCLFWGDYDPAGLRMFLRLKAVVPRFRFLVPDDLEENLLRHGNSSDLERQIHLMGELERSSDSQVQTLLQLFSKHGKTLHQECLIRRTRDRLPNGSTM